MGTKREDRFELLVFANPDTKQVTIDYIIQNTPEIMKMVFGEMIANYAKKQEWSTPWRLVVKTSRGATCLDWKYTPGMPHKYIEVPSRSIQNPPWGLTLTSSDGREIVRTLILTQQREEFIWKIDGVEFERWGLLRGTRNPTTVN